MESRLGPTRRCLEVLAEFRNPLAVITKRRTVTRDADLYTELARHQVAVVFMSVTSLDARLQLRGAPLPHGVKELFAAWLERHFPDRKEKVPGRARAIRGGKLYDLRYHVRGRGGVYAGQLEALFRVTRCSRRRRSESLRGRN